MKTYIVELDVIGFIGPVRISIPEGECGYNEEEIINCAFEHLTLTKSNDASFVSITEGGEEDGG